LAALGYSPRANSHGAPSFKRGFYPCYCVAVTELQHMKRLPEHEDALNAGWLEALTPSTITPCSAFTYFISQNWETFGDAPHPDNSRCTKLNWLKRIRDHMEIPSAIGEVWVWWDLICIPQREREQQKAAIRSLCYYAQLCSRFIPLVRDEKEWTDIYAESIATPGYPTAGTLATYSARGWCRLEMVAGLAPKKFSTGSWRPGPRNVRFTFHHDPSRAGIGPLFSADLLRNPLEGQFTCDADREVIEPVLATIAARYAEYAASGSDAWDATIDVHSRPRWLKELAGVDGVAAECAAVDPTRTEFSNLLRPFRPVLATVASPMYGASAELVPVLVTDGQMAPKKRRVIPGDMYRSEDGGVRADDEHKSEVAFDSFVQIDAPSNVGNSPTMGTRSKRTSKNLIACDDIPEASQARMLSPPENDRQGN
jgi:hypothetical protein